MSKGGADSFEDVASVHHARPVKYIPGTLNAALAGEEDPVARRAILHRQYAKTFEPLPAISGGCMDRVSKAVGMGLGLGFVFNLVAVPWRPDPLDHLPKGATVARNNWLHLFRGFSRPMGVMTVVFSTFAGVDCLMEEFNGHEKHHWNAAMGGFAAGMVLGATTKRFDTSLLTGCLTGTMMGMMEYAGLHYASDADYLATKIAGRRPATFVESEDVTRLKQLYPEYKDL